MNKRRTAASCVIASLVVVSILATPVIAGFKSGQYVGTTSQLDQVAQPLNVGFDVPKNKNKVNIVYFEFLNVDCNKVTQVAGETVKLKKSGKFKLKDADLPFSSGYIKGKFKGKKASGTAEFPDRCPSAGVIDWEAEKDS
ncbi:MAG TPA: hypothetical protein VNP73_02515 [Actinomycetota bacterium]|nr:hypothetical protein [Actinomycetota bacterium]